MNNRVRFRAQPSIDLEILALLLHQLLTSQLDDRQPLFDGRQLISDLRMAGPAWKQIADLLEGWSADSSNRKNYCAQQLSIVTSCFEIALQADPLPKKFHTLVNPIRPDISQALISSTRHTQQILRKEGLSYLLSILRKSPPCAVPYPASADLLSIEAMMKNDEVEVILVPSALWLFQPVYVLIESAGRLYIVYPATRIRSAERPDEAPNSTLVQLIGGTRAAILKSIVCPTNTTTLATKLGISVPSASRHTTLLRQAGLISSARCGQSVKHRPTALGMQLIYSTECYCGQFSPAIDTSLNDRIWRYLFRRSSTVAA